MTLSPVVLKSSSAVLSLALLSTVAATTVTSSAPAPSRAAPSAHATPTKTWLVAQKDTLCRIWTSPSGFRRHCTTKWYRDNHGNISSDDPNWVPVDENSDFQLQQTPQWRAWSAHERQQAWIAAHQPPVVHTAPAARSAPVVYYAASASSGPYGLWTPPPGHPAYYLADYAGDPNAAFWGYCTWYAQYRRPDERLMNLGNAGQWAYTAPSHGLSVGTEPAVGATVVYQGGLGHVSHVEALLGGGWFLVSEMNMYWNGGGFGRVSYRYSVAGPGVTFIY